MLSTSDLGRHRRKRNVGAGRPNKDLQPTVAAPCREPPRLKSDVTGAASVGLARYAKDERALEGARISSAGSVGRVAGPGRSGAMGDRSKSERTEAQRSSATVREAAPPTQLGFGSLRIVTTCPD